MRRTNTSFLVAVWMAILAGWSPAAVAQSAGAQAGAAPKSNAGQDESPRFWGDGEYLLHWVKDGPIADSLLTLDDPITGAVIPTVHPKGDEVIVGDSDLDYGAFSGGRFTFGGWLDSTRVWGLEGSGFFLAKEDSTFSASSSGGSPYLAIPLSINGVAQAIPLSLTNLFGTTPLEGAFSLESSSGIWGAEVGCLRNLDRGDHLSWDLIGGFRHLSLEEEVNSRYTTVAMDGTFSAFAQDRFAAETRFYGVQIGSRFEWDEGPWSVNILGKVALGANDRSVTIAGNGGVVDSSGGVPAATPYGVFALPGNIGRHSESGFAAVTEFKLAFGYQVTRKLRLSVGYDFLYWSAVARPGDQIDTAIGSTGTIPDGFSRTLDDYLNFIGPSGTTGHGTAIQESGFWTQGLELGLELSF